MKDYVEATERVTGILVRLGARETVESEEIEAKAPNGKAKSASEFTVT